MSTTTVPPAETAASGLLTDRAWEGKEYIAGWVDAPSTIESTEPATGEVLGTAGLADTGSIDRAVAAAAAAQGEWAATPMHERIAIVDRVSALLMQHFDELQSWIVRESGSIPPKAAVELNASVGQNDQAAGLISHPLGHVLPSLTPGRASVARRVPLGVVGVITPWNFPVVLAMRSLAPALVLGNAVVLK